LYDVFICRWPKSLYLPISIAPISWRYKRWTLLVHMRQMWWIPFQVHGELSPAPDSRSFSGFGDSDPTDRTGNGWNRRTELKAVTVDPGHDFLSGLKRNRREPMWESLDCQRVSVENQRSMAGERKSCLFGMSSIAILQNKKYQNLTRWLCMTTIVAKTKVAKSVYDGYSRNVEKTK